MTSDDDPYFSCMNNSGQLFFKNHVELNESVEVTLKSCWLVQRENFQYLKNISNIHTLSCLQRKQKKQKNFFIKTVIFLMYIKRAQESMKYNLLWSSSMRISAGLVFGYTYLCRPDVWVNVTTWFVEICDQREGA